jgi:hypothetical protein
MFAARDADTAGMDTKTPQALKPIEIFKAGSFIASNGQKYTFTQAQVLELAQTYKPEFSDAPFVVGHPKMTSPRFGHAGKLFINDAGVLCAEPADVVPEFADAVNAKHYPKVSASIFLPNAPGNPTPGKHYLRHVGFLGGTAPAVKGLKTVEFAGSAEGIAEFGYEDRLIVRMFRNLRDWMVETVGLEKADAVLPGWNIESLEENVTREEIASQANNGGTFAASFSAPTTEEEELNTAAQQQELATREAALKTDRAALDARAADLDKLEAAARKTGHADFCEALCTEGKLLPAQKASVVEIMSQLDAVNQVADFAQGDANHGKTGAELFKAYLSAQPKQVEFKRVAPAAGELSDTVDFAMPPGASADAESMALLGKAREYQKSHPDVDIVAAAKAVSQ